MSANLEDSISKILQERIKELDFISSKVLQQIENILSNSNINSFAKIEQASKSFSEVKDYLSTIKKSDAVNLELLKKINALEIFLKEEFFNVEKDTKIDFTHMLKELLEANRISEKNIEELRKVQQDLKDNLEIFIEAIGSISDIFKKISLFQKVMDEQNKTITEKIDRFKKMNLEIEQIQEEKMAAFEQRIIKQMQMLENMQIKEIK